MGSLSQDSDFRELAIDWYDGLVTGLVRFGRSSDWLFASLLAWNYNSNEKVYVVVPVDQEAASRLAALISQHPWPKSEAEWHAVQAAVSRMLRKYQGIVRLVRCRRLSESILGEREIDIDEQGVRSSIGRDVEFAFHDEQIEKWFALVVPRRPSR